MILLHLAILVLAPVQASAPKVTALDEFISSVPVGALMKIYGFCLGQEMSLEATSQKYPVLNREVTLARTQFSSRLGPACDQVEDRIRDEAGTKWPEIRKSLEEEVQRLMGSPGSLDECMAGIQMVKERAYGKIEAPFLELLLSQHPDYLRSPAKELVDGYKRTYESKEHPKALGINVQLVVPASWVASEGERPHIVQKFRSEAGYGSMEALLQVRPFSEGMVSLTREEESALFSEEGLKLMYPDCLERKPITLEGQPAGLIVSEEVQERLGIKVYGKYMTYVLFFRDHLVMLQCCSRGIVDDRKQIETSFDRAKALFLMIGNSIVLPDRYGR